MTRPFARSAPWMSLAGVVVMLLGLAWDARLHQAAPGLAGGESLVGRAVPAHNVAALGVGLAAAGSASFLIGRTGAWRATLARVAGVAGALGQISLSLATASAAAKAEPAHSHARAQASLPSVAAGALAARVGGPTHSHSAGTPTPEQEAAAEQLVADTIEGTRRFADFDRAVAEGYRQVTPYWNGQSGPAHFSNLAYSRDGRLLDPTRPETLVYFRTRSGQMRLLGAMYAAPKGQGPDVGGPLTPWHVHENLCFGPAGASAAIGPRACQPGSVFVGDAVEMLHVWTFDHPDGPFADHLSLAALLAAAR